MYENVSLIFNVGPPQPNIEKYEGKGIGSYLIHSDYK